MENKNKYNESIIYQITCNDPNITDTYIGSTTDYKTRIRRHKNSCNNEKDNNYNCKVYQFIRENGGFDNFTFNILEECNCENKNDLQKKERYYIQLLKSNLNNNIPTRTQQEYELENRDKILEYQKQYNLDNIEKYKQYYINNKNKILEYQKQKIICNICNSEVCRSSLSRHKKSLYCLKFQKLIEN